MAIVTLPLTYQMANGQTADASQVMADLNQIATNVNANAAPLDSAAFINTPTAPTPPANDSTTRIATTAYVQTSLTLTTKGDILARTATANVRKPVSSDGSSLECDSTQADGLSWKLTPIININRNAVNQSIPSSVETKVQLTNKSIDNTSSFDNTTNYRWTPTTAGRYFIKFCGKILSMADQNFYISRIKKNGVIIAEEIRSASGAIDVSNSVDTIVDMNGSTDYLEAFVYQNNAGSLNLSGQATETYITGFRVAA